MSSTVELFCKIFTSAETVASLAGEHGVESQFANRMNLIEAGGNVTTRPVYIEKDNYAASLRNYMGKTLNSLFDGYIALGRNGAAAAARTALVSFHDSHGIANTYGLVDAAIPEIAKDFEAWVKRNGHVTVREHDLVGLVFGASKLLEEYLEGAVQWGELGTLNYKTADILREMSADGRGSCNHKFNGRQRRGVIIETDQSKAKKIKDWLENGPSVAVAPRSPP
ncbi:hypothetical protein [Aliiruegeria sabulilitoris]|uniref:hypothetical protein n=1 Tax=Aliiruegeria sabulilitoris TaxID=1510458 RepID=UPI00082ED22F|nr:hypothetical protein [Aliiruegeria sabulilitoris]NDR56613.1 hypothetical protein [Pseudoruegeria sp. M32A2M]